MGTILWRGKWIIAIALATTLATVVVATVLTPKVYRSTAILQVGEGAVPRNGNESALSAQQASQGLATQYATLLRSRSFLERLRGRVGLSASELQSQLNAAAVPETGLIELSLKGRSPAAASRLAGSTASGFIDTLQADAQRQSDKLQAESQKRIAALGEKLRALGASSAPAAAAQRAALRAVRAALTDQFVNGVAQSVTQGVSLAAPPAAADSPASPRPVLNLIAGLVLGLLVGVGLAYVRARTQPSLMSSEDAEDVVHLPVLASIPLRRRFSTEDRVLREAYEMLRANIVFHSPDKADQVIAFASYSSGEGKTSTVQGMVGAARHGGKSLLVIDGDMRTRQLSSRLGHAGSPGLTSILSDGASPDSAIVELAPGVSLLPAGPAPGNAPALLDSEAMRDLVETLRGHYPLILIDAPPSRHLADAGIIASLSDALIVVARVGQTSRKDLQTAVLNLSHSRTPIYGLVVLEPRHIDRRYFDDQPSSSGTSARPLVSQSR